MDLSIDLTRFYSLIFKFPSSDFYIVPKFLFEPSRESISLNLLFYLLISIYVLTLVLTFDFWRPETYVAGIPVVFNRRFTSVSD